jgi:type II restriction enzyme
MKLGFSEPQRAYDSGSQIARSLTESWVSESMYCPNCGNPKLHQFQANRPVADFYCPHCNDQYELKSQKKNFGKKVIDGAYATKLQRLKSDTSPNLLLMSYDPIAARVRNLCAIPRRFFVPSIVEKRKPLAPNARRAGWIGSNIILSKIPKSGRVFFRDGVVADKQSVLAEWQRTAFLNSRSNTARGWLIEVMGCVDQLDQNGFTLDEVYEYETHLSDLYPRNKNVRPKIRQQLQVLRDNGYLKFLVNGKYRLAQ